jgi:thiol-disulfide isomerase/thioredoxin
MIHHYTFDKPSDIKQLSSNNYDVNPVIILVYMKGCPYCDMIKPTWNDFKQSNVIDTIDVNYEILPQFNAINTNLFTSANAFPFIKSNVMKEEHRGAITIDELIKLSNTSKEKTQKKQIKKATDKKKTTDTKKKATDKKKTTDSKKKATDKKKTTDSKKKATDTKKESVSNKVD